MPDPRRGQPPPDEIDLTGREFLDAQEPQSPATVAEMRDATRHAFDSAIKTLGNTASLEEWVAATNDLEAAFFDANGGALAEQIRLALGKDTLDAAEWAASEELVRQTAAVAARIYTIVHRLQALGFAATREEVVRKLEVGELSATTKVHGVSVTPRRRTLIGLLRDLDAKLGANIWSLEFPPTLPAKVVVADPFDVGTEDTARLWRQRVVAKNAVEPDAAHSILTISGDVTTSVAYELDRIGERTSDPKLKEATETVVAWLNRKSVYYQDPDKRDFAMYHLGMEQPQDLMKIFRSLDTIKHADPELFLELVGINPDGGGTSPYFGSFLHKAIFNTQKAVDRADRLGELAIRTMLRQLLTLNATVSTYSGVVSQEALKAMGAQIKDRVESEPNSADKAKTLMMLAVPFSQVAIDAEVRRQLDELREANLENVKAEFKRHLDDHDHPLKFLEYVRSMPRAAYDDEDIRRIIRTTFNVPHMSVDERWPDATAIYAWMLNEFYKRDDALAAPLYRRIPLLDESRADLGFGRRLVIAARDIAIDTGPYNEVDSRNRTNEINRLALCVGKSSLSILRMPAVLKTLIPWNLRLTPSAELLNDLAGSNYGQTPASSIPDLIACSELDRAFFNGQMLIATEKPNVANILKSIPNPDLVLLSVLANPNGAAVAFEHFDKFCERIEPERMLTILHDQIPFAPKHPGLQKFRKEFFDREAESYTVAYVARLRREIITLYDLNRDVDPETDIDLHLKLNRVLVEKKAPWTVKAFHGGGDARKNTFDLYQAIADSKGKTLVAEGHYLPVPGADQIEWGEREQAFVTAQLKDEDRWKPTVTYSIEHGIVLAMHSPNKPPGEQNATLQLNLKSRPA